MVRLSSQSFIQRYIEFEENRILNLFFSFLFSLLQNEKAQLYTHRSTMLRLNASVHSWLTRQELKNADRKQMQVTTTSTITSSAGIDGSMHDANGNAIDVIGDIDNGIGKTVTDIGVNEITSTQGTDTNEFSVDDEFHKQLKNEVGNMYTVWEEADQR